MTNKPQTPDLTIAHRIDGIALVGFDHDSVALNMLEQRDVPVISIWNYDEGEKIPSVGADNRLAGELITRHVLELGHRDIAVIFPDTANNDRARDRMEGVMRTLKGEGILLDEKTRLNSSYDLGEAKNVADSLLRENSPSAIICGNDIIAHGVIFAAQRLGIRIPEDLSVVGIGDFGGSEYMEPELTTVRLPAKRIGIQAANTLLAMSETGMSPKPFHNSIPLELKTRNSARAV